MLENIELRTDEHIYSVLTKIDGPRVKITTREDGKTLDIKGEITLKDCSITCEDNVGMSLYANLIED